MSNSITELLATTNETLYNLLQLKLKSGWIKQTLTRGGFITVKNKYMKPIYEGGSIIIKQSKDGLKVTYKRTPREGEVDVSEVNDPLVRSSIREVLEYLKNTFEEPLLLKDLLTLFKQSKVSYRTLLRMLPDLNRRILTSRLEEDPPNDQVENTLHYLIELRTKVS